LLDAQSFPKEQLKNKTKKRWVIEVCGLSKCGYNYDKFRVTYTSLLDEDHSSILLRAEMNVLLVHPLNCCCVVRNEVKEGAANLRLPTAAMQ
jgi:hypothetical protein